MAAVVISDGWARAERPTEKKIREELAKVTSFEFNETPLREVMKYLNELHGINIELNQKALGDANVIPDTPVSKVLKGVSLESALNLTLRDLGATYVIEDGVLQITSPEAAQRDSVPRIYDLTGLGGAADRETLLKAVELVLDRPANGPDGKPMPVASRLLIFRDKLILRGSQPEHDRTTELLRALREPPPGATAVELAPPPAVGEATTRKPRQVLKRPARSAR
jgi:hypothetical protein